MSKMRERSSVRTYDEDGFVKRAACICVNDNESKVLLVTSRKDSQMWIVPGGGVEPDELPDVAAVREVREEAGVNGSLGRCLGVFENAERGHRTSVYVLVVTEELEEWEDSKSIGRQRKWFDIAEAVEKLKHKPVQSSYVNLLLSQTLSKLTGEESATSNKDYYKIARSSSSCEVEDAVSSSNNEIPLIVCAKESDDINNGATCDNPNTEMVQRDNCDAEEHSTNQHD